MKKEYELDLTDDECARVFEATKEYNPKDLSEACSALIEKVVLMNPSDEQLRKADEILRLRKLLDKNNVEY